MRSDNKFREQPKMSQGPEPVKNTIPRGPVAQSPMMFKFPTPSKKPLRVFQPQVSMSRQGDSFQHNSVHENTQDGQDFDHTVMSFLRTMDVDQAKVLKNSLRAGQALIRNDYSIGSNSKCLSDQILTRLTQQIQVLPLNQRQQYLEALEDIEQGKPINDIFINLYTQTTVSGRRQNSGLQSIPSDNQTLTLRILSNYGHPTYVGLTELQIFDINGNQIPINPNDILCVGQVGIERIFNSNTFTIKEEHMWTTIYKRFPIDISIRVAFEHLIGSIKIWNYNKSVPTLNIGVKLVEVLHNETSIISCDVRKGSGTMYEDYSQSIKLQCFMLNTERNYESSPVKKYTVDTPKQQHIMNVTQQSNQSQQTKKSEDSIGINRDTFISNASHNLSKVSQSRSYKHPKIASNPFDEDSKQLRKSSVQKQQTKDTQHFKVFSESNLLQKGLKQNPKGMIRMQVAQPLLNMFPQKQEQVGQNEIRKATKTQNFLQIQSQSIQEQSVSVQMSGIPKRITIPELPIGRFMKIKLIRSWGDKNYVGISAVEVFNVQGDKVRIKTSEDCQQVVHENCLTCDERYMWVKKAPSAEIMLDLGSRLQISMIRIWNYNKSRTYSSRGVRDMIIILDDEEVQQTGEIKKAFGTLNVENCELIMFTKNPQIITSIDAKDWINERYSQPPPNLESTIKLNRPDTATFQHAKYMDKTKYPAVSIQVPRFIVGAGSPIALGKITPPSQSLRAAVVKLRPSERVASAQRQVQVGIKAKTIQLQLLKNWGDKHFIGLCGVDFMDKMGNRIKVKQVQGPGNVKRLVSGETQTTDSESMWWHSIITPPTLKFFFDNIVEITFIKFWNYNQKFELDRGVSYLRIMADDQIVSQEQGLLLRRGPGLDQCDYSQKITIPTFENAPKRIIPIASQNNIDWQNHEQDYETVLLPQGLKLTVNIISTWGDQFYVGLNGIELFDPKGKLIAPTKLKILAQPNSVKELAQLGDDIRTPDKLIDGENITLDDRHMWLAPLTTQEQISVSVNPSFGEQSMPKIEYNTIQLLFEEPVQISAIQFYNYSKTPHRGAREVEMFLDDALIYKGFLNISNLLDSKTRQLDGNNKTTIIFTENQDIIQSIGPVSMRQSILGTDTLLFNENQKMTYHQISNEEFRSLNYYQLQRPTTRVKGL